jgi:RNA polymerase sigma-70 factor (ECF subfamily)
MRTLRDEVVVETVSTRAVARVEVLVAGKHRFLNFLKGRTGSWADAEDVLQSALLKVVADAEALRDEERLLPWFYRVLRSTLADHHRRRAAQARLESRLATAAERDGGEDEELARAVCGCIADVLNSLKRGHADLLRAVELQEQPLRQVAARIGVTANNAAVRLHRARHALRDGLRDLCRACAEHGCLDCTCRPRAAGL